MTGPTGLSEPEPGPASEPAPGRRAAPSRQVGSLRHRLLRGLLFPVSLIIVVSAALPYVLALRPAEEAFDRALGDGAYALAAMIRSTPPVAVRIDSQAADALRSDSVDRVLFAVQGPDGATLAGDPVLAGEPADRTEPNPWVHTEPVAGVPMRLFDLQAPCGGQACRIRVAETLRKRDDLRRGTLLASLVPECVLGIFIVLFVVHGVRRALLPLTDYSDRLLTLGAEGWRDLPADHAVEEVRPLILALNSTAAQLRDAADSQQRFLSTAAHQLRTPLAGLKASVDLARLADDPVQVRTQLDQLSRSADRVARLATQLLALARVEPHVQDPQQRRRCDLAELATDLVEDALRQASGADIDLGFELEPAPVLGHPLLLRELLANLVDNAMRYTPRGGRVTVRTGLGADRSKAWLEVEDDGPGIPADQREAVLERFARLPGTRGEGSGLGLAIVRDICESHAAQLVLEDAQPARATGPGLRVRVLLAAALAPATP